MTHVRVIGEAVFSARPALMDARVRFSDAPYKTGASGLDRRQGRADCGVDRRALPGAAPAAALLRLAEKGTLDERSVGVDDVDLLRAAGYDDAGILSAIAAIAHHHYAVRVAAALGAST